MSIWGPIIQTTTLSYLKRDIKSYTKEDSGDVAHLLTTLSAIAEHVKSGSSILKQLTATANSIQGLQIIQSVHGLTLFSNKLTYLMILIHSRNQIFDLYFLQCDSLSLTV